MGGGVFSFVLKDPLMSLTLYFWILGKMIKNKVVSMS
jgi:hypothetical protein